jgi:hypothetical protein
MWELSFHDLVVVQTIGTAVCDNRMTLSHGSNAFPRLAAIRQRLTVTAKCIARYDHFTLG